MFFRKKQTKQKRITPFEPGFAGNMFGVQLTVVGIVVYSQYEEGKYYFWENIYLKSTDGREYWLDYDQYSDEFTLFQRAEFDEQAFRSSKHKTLISGDDKLKVVERGNASIVGIIGSVPEYVQNKKQIKFLDAIGFKGLYSLEWDDTVAALYLGQNISHINVYNGFGLKQQAHKYLQSMRSRVKWHIIDKLASFLFFCLLMLLFLALVGNKTIYQKEFNLCAGTLPTCPTSATIPFEISGLLKTHRITLESDVTRANSISTLHWKYITFEIADSSNQVTNGFNFEIYSEYWREDGETGVETKTAARQDLIFDKAGRYTGTIYIETSDQATTSKPHAVKVKIEKRAVQETPVVVASVICGVYLIIRFFASKAK